MARAHGDLLTLAENHRRAEQVRIGNHVGLRQLRNVALAMFHAIEGSRCRVDGVDQRQQWMPAESTVARAAQRESAEHGPLVIRAPGDDAVPAAEEDRLARE